MKGIVFNVVEEVVVDNHGEDSWEDILDSTGLDGVYTALGTYPDEHFQRIVCAGSAALEVGSEALVRDLGRCSLAKLALRFPQFFQPFAATRPFMMTLNDVIHAEVRKLYPGALVPEFDLDDSDPDWLVIGYDSPRRLCHLAEGFILGAADHFREAATIEQSTCMHRGDATCTLRCTFTPK